MHEEPSAVFTKKKNHYIFSSQLRADQMPGPPTKNIVFKEMINHD